VIRPALVTVVLIPVLFAACGDGQAGDAGDSEAAAPAVVTVDTAGAQVRPFTVRVDALGEVVARPGSLAELAAPAPSRVGAIYVVPGQRVRAGDSLVALDRTVFEADARRAEANAETADQALARARRLVDDGILARKDLEQAAAAAAAAQAELASARRVEQLAVLRSPIDGVVSDLSAVLEASADPGTTLVRVVDPSGLEAVLRVSPEEAARVQPGADVEVSATSGSSDVLARGSVRAVSPALDPTSGTVEVRVRLGATSRTLRLGEALTGHIAVTVHDDAVVIPVAALVPAGDGEEVFVVDAQGVAHAREVTVGGRDGAEAEILEGLKGGETVVTQGAYGVTDGATIRVGAER